MNKKIKTAVILGAACSLLLACSDKKEIDKTSMFKPSEKVANNKKTDATTSSTPSNEDNPSHASEGIQNNPKTASTESVERIITATELKQLPSVAIPDELVGRWQGSSQQIRAVDMTIGRDGSVYTFTDFRQNEEDDTDAYTKTFVGLIEELVEYKPNHYIIRKASGDASALIPGVTGLGGRITPGFILENGTYQVVLWGNPMDETIEAEYDLSTEPIIHSKLTKFN